MERTIHDVMLDNHEERIKTIENTSMNLLVAIEKQSLVVGIMAKAMLGGAGATMLVVAYALLNLILKRPLHV